MHFKNTTDQVKQVQINNPYFTIGHSSKKENSSYVEIKTLFQGSHDFNTLGDFQHIVTYTPETVHPSGSYRVKLEVTAPNGIKEQYWNLRGFIIHSWEIVYVNGYTYV